MDIKTEIKEEPSFCRMSNSFFPKEMKENFKSEEGSMNNILDNKAEIKEETHPTFCSSNNRELFNEDPVMNFHRCNKDYEEDTAIEIKEEEWWLERSSKEIPCLCSQIKDGTDNVLSAESSRLLTRVVSSSKPAIIPDEDFGKTKSMRRDSLKCKTAKKCRSQEIDITEISPKGNCVHSDEPHCGEMNGTNSSLNKSSLTQQNNIKACDVYKKNQVYKSVLVRYNFSPENSKAYKCEVCQKGFTHLSSLKTHNLIHEDEVPFKCSICEKGFTKLSALKAHTLIHEGKKPHKCDICEKRFTLLTNLRKHNYIHEAVKPYNCNICQKGFTQLHSLKGHILIHQGIKPHKCDICKKNFTLLTSLKRHAYMFIMT